jgi:hypothetical protein
MSNLVQQLRDGCILFPKRWSGDTGFDRPYGTLDEASTDVLMAEAADEITRLRNALELLLDQLDPPSYQHDPAWHALMAQACRLVGREKQACEHEKKAR